MYGFCNRQKCLRGGKKTAIPFLPIKQGIVIGKTLKTRDKEIIKNRLVFLAANLEVGLSSKGPVLDVADLILGKIEVSEICEAEHGGKQHCLKFVLIQPQVVNLRDTREQMVFRRCIAPSGCNRGGPKTHCTSKLTSLWSNE